MLKKLSAGSVIAIFSAEAVRLKSKFVDQYYAAENGDTYLDMVDPDHPDFSHSSERDLHD